MRYRHVAAFITISFACGSHANAPPPEPAVTTAPATAAPRSAAPKLSDVAARRATLAALLDEQWQYQLRTSPEKATAIGDKRYNDRWSDASPASCATA